MQRLEVSGVVRPIHGSLSVRRLKLVPHGGLWSGSCPCSFT